MGSQHLSYGGQSGGSSYGSPGGQSGSYGGYGEPGSRSARRWPKGYQRSDERIKEDIYERLLQNTHLDATEVTVNVQGGRVTLEGSVPQRHMKHAIEDMVDDCPGVSDIENRLRVSQGQSQGFDSSSAIGSGGSSAMDECGSYGSSASGGATSGTSGTSGSHSASGTSGSASSGGGGASGLGSSSPSAGSTTRAKKD
jgi:hypothetical protein